MRKNYLLIFVLLLTTAIVHAANITWSDVTKRFVENPDFNDGSSDGWTVNSTAGLHAVSAECMRFYNGTFDFYQEISYLPKGTYRLSVQGFYRSSSDSYNAYKNGTDNLTAYLYAGTESAKLVSIYSQPMTRPVGSCKEHDGNYYPDNSVSSSAAFEQGLYHNSLEFQSDGSVTIGVRCQEAESNNYCALDNFRLEYASDADGMAWVDVTDRYLKNTAFDGNDRSEWSWNSNASSQSSSYECMEFWNGIFDLWQTVKNAPAGQYRLSVQAFYRCKDNYTNEQWSDYFDYVNGTQNITAYMYAGDKSQQLRSVYSDHSDSYVDGCWAAGGKYYPDNMYSASVFFGQGRYWNSMEFEGEGTFDIGLRCQENEYSNWCIFDNFKLEYYTGIVQVSSITISLPTTELVIGETVTATATVLPEMATLPFVDWTTSNPKVATIDKDGLITAVGLGTATITATAYDGSGVKSSVTITVGHNPASTGSLIINEIMASNVDEFISPAFNFDGWVELYNPTNRAVELGGVKVSDGTSTWTMPSTAGVIPAKGYSVVWFDSNDGNPNNAPFKLDTDGGVVVFSNANGVELARQDYPASLERISYARSADGGGSWGMTGTPTPGSSNNGIVQATTQIDAPMVDQPSQLFTGSLSVKVTIPSGCTLRFTTDGTLPTMTNGNTSGDGRFTVTDTRCFRFRLFANGMLPSRVSTRSYIYKDKDYYLPVVSVVTDRDFLYSKEIGVMAKGPNGRPGNGKDENCNWNMDWERPVNFSYLTADGEMVLNQDVNLEMCGGWSRAWTPHSFKLKGSKELGGDKNLLYPFFEQKPYIRNRTLQIRNGGNDNQARFKDASLQVVLASSGIDVDYQSYQPVHEFINGSYIGVLNVREPNNKHYVYANYGWDEDEIDQFEMSPDSAYIQKCGTPDAFLELVDVLSPDAANAQTYEEICRLLDIDAYINYMATQMYLGGTDFPQNNVKGFRHRDGGRFRFVLFDLDFAFSTPNPFNVFFNKEYYTFDQLKPASLGRLYNEQIRFVTLFKNMLQNQDFRRRFIDAYCIIGGSVFEKERSAAIIDELLERVEPAMNLENNSALGKAEEVKSGLGSRLRTAISALRNYGTFKLTSSMEQQVSLGSNVEGSRLFINSQVVPTGRFDGILFAPVKLRAEAPAGYVFSGWVDASGHFFSSSPEFTLPTGNLALTATFSKLNAAESKRQGFTPVRINEVSGANDSFIDEYGKKGDWVELYNTTDEPVDVEGMFLTDNVSKPTKYQITKGDTKANTVIPAHGYLIIWCDNKRPTSDKGLHANFKIADDGGLLMLSAANQSWSDVMTYEAHDARTTIGRYPDGAASVYTMNVATIAKANVYSSYMTAVEQSGIPDGLVAAVASDLRLVYGSGQLLVKSAVDGPVTVEVYRADGLMVSKTVLDVQGGSAHLSVDDLPTGFYVARVTGSQNGKSSCRFVK